MFTYSIRLEKVYCSETGNSFVGFGFGKIPGITKITAGRNSWSAVYKSGLTKLRNGTATKMSLKTLAKGIGSSIADDFLLDIYFGIKQVFQ